MNKESFNKCRPYIKVGIVGLVECFTGAVRSAVMSHVEGGRLSRAGAKVGGMLVGYMIGEKVGDCVCDGIEGFLDGIENFKEAIDEVKEEQ